MRIVVKIISTKKKKKRKKKKEEAYPNQWIKYVIASARSRRT